MALAADEFFGRPTAELTVAGVTGTAGRRRRRFSSTPFSPPPGAGPGLLGTIETRVDGERRPADPHDRRGDRPPAPVPRDARRRRPQLRDGGDLARLGAAAPRLRPLLRRSCSPTSTRTTSTSTTTWRTTSTRSAGCSSASPRHRGRQPRRSIRPPPGGRAARTRDAAPHLRPHRRRRDPPRHGRGRRRSSSAASTSRTSSAPVAAARLLGLPDDAVARGVASIAGVPGRFQSVDEGQDFAVIVDYAHKPGALENVLRTARELPTAA